jgi:hypothetical protein
LARLKIILTQVNTKNLAVPIENLTLSNTKSRKTIKTVMELGRLVVPATTVELFEAVV